MADPKNYVPRSISQTAIHSLLRLLSSPLPTSITLLSTSAGYHTIYTLSYAPSALSQLFLPSPPPENSSPTTLILRISGPRFPSIKTQNECTILKWVATYPDPIVHYNATRDNPLGYEFILMTMAVGQSFDLVRSDLFASLSGSSYQEYLAGYVRQVVDILSELQSHHWHQIGGLGKCRRVLEVIISSLSVAVHLQRRTCGKFPNWTSSGADCDGEKVTVQSLNATGPFQSYVSFLMAQAEKYVFAIRRHLALSSMLGLIPRIEGFITAMERHQEELNKTRLVLAHRDFHFGNIMYDVSTRQITAVLDWEFAAIVPAQRWDPQKAFLWNCMDNNDEEKIGLREMVVKGCRQRGVTFFEDVEYTSKRQEHMQLAMNFRRAIVEVLPRSQVEKPVEALKESMLVHLDAVSSD